jgi:hypothetical protein
MNTYVGIADAHGIESFTDGEPGKVPWTMKMRASLNRQRHALVYQVELDDKGRSEVEGLIVKGQFKKALKFLKAQPSFSVEEEMRRSADMIPDDKLDPYWGQ